MIKFGYKFMFIKEFLDIRLVSYELSDVYM
jgi:hypothetical protein